MNKPSTDTKPTNKSRSKKYDAHISYIKLHFNDSEMDFAFGWIFGSTPFGGCEIGEAFYVINSIEDGNPESWQAEWIKMAERVASQAKTSLKANHKISARIAFLKAANYYRASLISMSPKSARFREMTAMFRSCFREAGKLFDVPVEFIDLPFENTVLPGYFIKANNSGEKQKTLIMIGGGETFVEELYFYIAPAALKRGYNFLTFDLPGQGDMPEKGHFFRCDMEVPMKAVLDYAYSRNEIDRDRLAVFGISNGGYFVPRAAMFDDRIKAVIVSNIISDNYRAFKKMPFSTDTQEQIDKWPPFKYAVISAVSWRWGLDPADLKGQLEKSKDCQFDPAQIKCPFLDIVSEAEYASEEIYKQQQECMNALSNPNKKMVITTAKEGGASHCIGQNRTLMSQIAFDWLDELWS